MLACSVDSSCTDSREGRPSVTREEYLLTPVEHGYTVGGGSVAISTAEMSKVCPIVDYRATLSLIALLWP